MLSNRSEELPPGYHYDPAILVVLEPLVIMEFSSRSGAHGRSDHRTVQVAASGNDNSRIRRVDRHVNERAAGYVESPFG